MSETGLTKICTKCKKELNLDRFSKRANSKDGKQKKCKNCVTEYNCIYYNKNSEREKTRRAIYYTANQQNIKIKRIEKYNTNNEKEKVSSLARYHLNPDKHRLANKNWKQRNKERNFKTKCLWKQKNHEKIKKYRSLYDKNRRLVDPLYNLTCKIHSLISFSLKIRNYTKRSYTYDLLCCSYEKLMIHLGPRPEGDMEIDHICPNAQAVTEGELISLQHYTNFRWLSAKENHSKLDKKTPEGEVLCRKLLGREWIDKPRAAKRSKLP